METDNPSLPYTDPTATPAAGLRPERLALSGASGAGDVSRVQTIITSLPDGINLPMPASQYLIDARLNSARNDLQDASRDGDVQRIHEIVQAWRSDPSLKDPTSEDMGMALILAAINAHPEAVQFLLDEGVPVGLMAPKLAAREGRGAIEVFQAFLDHSWDINSFDRIPSLHTATKSLSLTEWFLAHGADPNLISKDGHTPLDFAVTYPMPDMECIIDLLVSSGAFLSHSNSLHNAIITIPSDDDCLSVMELLLKKGVGINWLSYANQPDFQTENPSTALHWAVRKHSARRVKKNMLVRVKWLLDHGADIQARDSKGKIPVEGANDGALIGMLGGNSSPSR